MYIYYIYRGIIKLFLIVNFTLELEKKQLEILYK